MAQWLKHLHSDITVVVDLNLVAASSFRACLRVRSFGIFRNKNNSGHSAPGRRIAGMEIQVFRNENSSQTNAYSHYSNYSYSGLIPNERALNWVGNYEDLYCHKSKRILDNTEGCSSRSARLQKAPDSSCMTRDVQDIISNTGLFSWELVMFFFSWRHGRIRFMKKFFFFISLILPMKPSIV